MSVTPSSSRRVIVLHRVSTSAQDLQRQRTDTARVVQSHGLTPTRTLELSDVSGRKVLSDPNMQALLRDLKRPDVDGIAVSALDRLFRFEKFGDFSILDPFREAGKWIFSAKEGAMHMSTDMALILALMSGAQGGLEWRELRRRTMQGKEEHRLAGKHANGDQTLPRGLSYSKTTETWSYEEPDASRIKLAFDLLFAGDSYRTIAAKVGGQWTDKGIARSLTHKCWMGVYQYTENRPEPLDVDMKIEPLISPQRWLAAQKLMLERHSRWFKTKREKPLELLLSGHVRCRCGLPMYVRFASQNDKTHRRAYYFCKSAIKKYGPPCGAHTVQTEAADHAMERIALKEMRDAAFLRAALGRLEAARPALDDDALRLAHERQELELERQRLLQLTLKGKCTEDDFARESKRIEADIRSLAARTPAPLPDVFDPAKIIRALGRAFSRFGKQPFAAKRAVLMKLVREVVLDKGSITEMTLNGGYFTESVNSRAHCSV